ncbi:MAG: excinuclease ABC subunit UvrC, partial [Betaproteobacteria bacterium]|nr:excinuclease ABC subunit UvrC [Candidatus Proximibacter danicus]
MSEAAEPNNAPEAPAPFDHRTLLASMPELPGVYRMLDASGNVLYVGKAKALKKRVASYFRDNHPSPRIALMVRQIAKVETTVTRSEAEALLLENNLIKRLSPRYNILFRDDKSYPYILVSKDEFPRIAYYRGSLDSRRAEYFGPYPSASAVRDSVHLLQRMFRLRTCEDSVYANRSRPCLLHQIKRCSAPCVGLIDAAAYAEDLRLARLFLQGRQQEVIRALGEAMAQASANLAFEKAAIYRDQIQSLRHVQEKQHMESARGEDFDVIVAVEEGGTVCVNLAMVRGGLHLGDRAHFPAGGISCPPAEALSAFLQQHYLDHPIPERILVNLPPDDEEIGEALAAIAERAVPIVEARQAMHRVWVEMAVQNAQLAIVARKTTLTLQGKRQQALAEALGLESVERIECFDISHTQGEATVASCVVYQGNAMKKSEYRRFNISGIQPGDDYAAMRQAVQRRYEKVASGESVAPDLILIDGGKGQVSAAAGVMEELGLSHLPMIGVAKGEARKPGLETLIFPESLPNAREPLQLPPEHPGLHLVQEVRDEAHRFAVSGHRAQRGKTRKTSRLEEIEGVGPKRRKALIAQFGGLQGIV